MREFKLKISGDAGISPVIKVDGKSVRFKKNEFGSSEAIIKTERDEVEVCLYRYLEINSRGWIFFYLLYFVLSLFGLLDVRSGRDCTVTECVLRVHLGEKNEVWLAFGNQNGKVKVTTECEYDEIVNRCYVDQNAKRRYRILFAIELIAWLMLVALCVLLVVRAVNK